MVREAGAASSRLARGADVARRETPATSTRRTTAAASGDPSMRAPCADPEPEFSLGQNSRRETLAPFAGQKPPR
jgi:hypothetical protein